MKKFIYYLSSIMICALFMCCETEKNTVEAVEKEIYDEYAPNPHEVGYPINYKKFLNLLDDYPEETFAYDFQKLQGLGLIRQINSNDHSLRIYTNYQREVLLAQLKTPEGIVNRDINIDLINSKGFRFFIDTPTQVWALKTEKGDAAYLLCCQKSSSDSNFLTVYAIRYIDGNFVPGLVFKTEDGIMSADISTFTSDTSYVMKYEPSKQELIVPEDKGDEISFTTYKYNGKTFEEIGVEKRSILHASVQNYKVAVDDFTFGNNYIRVDLMSNGTYRYAAWNKGKALSSKPDLIIYNGKHTDNSTESSLRERYVFTNNGYTYIIETIDERQFYSRTLTIKNGDKIIASYTDE